MFSTMRTGSTDFAESPELLQQMQAYIDAMKDPVQHGSCQAHKDMLAVVL